MTKKPKVTLEKVATAVDKLTVTTDKLATLMVEGFESVHNDIGELRQDMTQVKRDISIIQKDMAEVKVDLKGHGKAIDADAKTIINHETRIKKLEHVR
ncbi:MAG: hypothetical protein Q7S50_00730 [bacterium]|nr:hypothetical protein [bacterium]